MVNALAVGRPGLLKRSIPVSEGRFGYRSVVLQPFQVAGIGSKKEMVVNPLSRQGFLNGLGLKPAMILNMSVGIVYVTAALMLRRGHMVVQARVLHDDKARVANKSRCDVQIPQNLGWRR